MFHVYVGIKLDPDKRIPEFSADRIRSLSETTYTRELFLLKGD